MFKGGCDPGNYGGMRRLRGFVRLEPGRIYHAARRCVKSIPRGRYRLLCSRAVHALAGTVRAMQAESTKDSGEKISRARLFDAQVEIRIQ